MGSIETTKKRDNLGAEFTVNVESLEAAHSLVRKFWQAVSPAIGEEYARKDLPWEITDRLATGMRTIIQNNRANGEISVTFVRNEVLGGRGPRVLHDQAVAWLEDLGLLRHT
jgi:hypothetical protein